MRGRLQRRLVAPVVIVLSVLTGIPLAEAGTGPAGRTFSASGAAAIPVLSEAPPAVDAATRDRVLAGGWRESNDLALATAGDASGFHVLVADARSGYEWRMLATLSEPGMDTDQWIGNACLTGSGDRVMAVYAPRHFTNRAELFARGAFAAIVDVGSGAVTKLDDQVTLAYFNPGCGADGTVALTQGADETRRTTRLLRVRTGTGKTSATVVAGQISSAVPYKDGVVAGRGGALVAVSGSGKTTTLAETGSVPFDLHVDAEGGVAFAEQAAAGRVTIRYHRDGDTRTLAQGRLGELSVRAGTAGRVFLVGKAEKVSGLPAGMRVLDGDSEGQVSSHGELLVKSAARHGLREGRAADPHDTGIDGVGGNSTEAEPVEVAAEVPATKASLTFAVPLATISSPRSRTGDVANPRLSAGRAKAAAQAKSKMAPSSAATLADDPVDDGYTCSVPRNDPKLQVYQPHWRQVEWAVDQLVQKRLTLTRPANWKGSGLPAWNPQTMFPAESLQGPTTGGRVPANIMLGILAQESNLWQAQRRAFEGETGNPLVGNYYGVDIYDDDPSNDWAIDFSKADCGYGISQQTDGMRKAGSERPGEFVWALNVQKAVALDYLTNIAAGLRTLTQKWNQIWTDTSGAMKANTGDPAKLENWYFALWAYNSGWHPKNAANGNDENGAPNNGAWGLGWTNNPSNSYWRPGRHPFLDGNTYQDAATPQYWPYQEKVLGWAAWPITKSYYDSAGTVQEQAGYNAAWWNTATDRSQVVPAFQSGPANFGVDVNAFCVPGTAGNECQPGAVSSGVPTPGICTRADFKCWWHLPKAWKTNCATACGNEGTIRYSDATWAGTEREEPTDYWTPCKTPGLPTGALIVDDVPSTVPAIRGGCDNSGWTNSGTFSLQFAHDAAGKTPAKADFQQLGNGFGGHQWFGYARDPAHNGAAMRIIGTWTLNQQMNGAVQVFVHLPDHYGYTRQARYDVLTARGIRSRVISQRPTKTNPAQKLNRWVSLGVFTFSGTPKVSLSTLNGDGVGDESVVFDAVAFAPATCP
ncbi:hypothetical protein [Microbispora sp. NPDC049125]|uniref:golvesin C-terminal-like domain-containing protein n=1 Tax=Microbispora sp. NPDC049125 TaxID=3154929 RepID=UPI0034658E03